MARALATGLGEPALFSDGGSGRAAILAEELGGEATSAREIAARADVVVLAHKPTQLPLVAQELRGARVVLSLLGGVTVAEVAAAIEDASVTRAMPNTAVAVRRGVTCVCGAEG